MALYFTYPSISWYDVHLRFKIWPKKKKFQKSWKFKKKKVLKDHLKKVDITVSTLNRLLPRRICRYTNHYGGQSRLLNAFWMSFQFRIHEWSSQKRDSTMRKSARVSVPRSSFIHGTSIRGKLLRYGQMSSSFVIFFLEDDFRWETKRLLTRLFSLWPFETSL